MLPRCGIADATELVASELRRGARDRGARDGTAAPGTGQRTGAARGPTPFLTPA
jgi:hypothetical protein